MAPSIFRAVLDLLEVAPDEAVMVGDTIADDVEGARAVGMRAILVDRAGLYDEVPDRIRDLSSLATSLGLTL